MIQTGLSSYEQSRTMLKYLKHVFLINIENALYVFLVVRAAKLFLLLVL